MALPDVIVRLFTAATTVLRPINTGTAFYVAQTPRGWTKKPRACRSMVDVENFFGSRQVATYFWDWAETFFQEGGTELFLSRAVHSDAVAGKIILTDTNGTPKKVLNVEAGSQGEAEPGAWSGSAGLKLKVEIVNTTGPPETFVIKVFAGTTLLEESPSLESLAAAVGWANATSNYIKLSLGSQAGEATAKLPKTLASTELTESAASDGSAVTDADYKEALTRITKEYGPGQVAMETGNAGTTTRQVYLLEHAALNNRFALLDGADTPTVATLVAQAVALYGASVVVNGVTTKARRFGQLFAPWDVAPGLVPSTLRTVPPSARQAAACAQVDALGNPNRSAAGARGTASWIADLSQVAWTDQQRLELNNAGVTVSRRRFGNAIATWGLRTLADQTTDTEWSMAPNVRCVMAMTALVERAMEAYEFDQVDGFGTALGKIQGDLNEIASSFGRKGALYGKTPQEMWTVNAGEALNPPAALREGKVTVEIAFRSSPGAEQINVRLVKVPITQPVT